MNQFTKNTFLIYLAFIFICVNVSSKAQSVIESIGFEGNTKFDEDELLDWSGLSIGGFVNKNTITETNKKLIDNLNSRGYLYARIDSVSVESDQKKKNIALIWHIKEGLPFYIGTINIDSDSIATEYIYSQIDIREGDIFNQDLLEKDIGYINTYLAEEGFPFAVLELRNFEVDKSDDYYSVNLNFNITSGKTAKISKIIINGNNVTEPEVILRELEVKPGDVYRQDQVEKIPFTLNKLGFFKNVKPAQFMITKDQQYVLVVDVEEGNTTSFDGVVGYVPGDQNSKSDEGYFTGLLNASFRNLFGTGRKFELFWEKPDKFSDQFKLYYEEPWIFGLPINTGVGLERLVRDTTYIERSYFTNTSLKINSDLKSIFSFYQKVTIPDSAASRDLRLARNITNTVEVGIEYDTRDYPINPRSGIFYSTKYSYGQKQNTGPSYLIQEDNLVENEELQKVQMDFALFLPVISNQLIYFHIFGSQIKSNEDQLQITDHTWFGGARTLRGYRENQFHGEVVSWLNLEYRFLIGRNSRIFVFNDWGFYNYKDKNGKQENILPGYGLGVRFDTALGIMGVDFGLGENDSFSTGKIHFGIENSF